jgi:hypothetical protein
MNVLDDVITYMRRILKTPSDQSITNSLLIDYINRFWINDVDARIQLFDLKKKYSFQTAPGIDRYNMPLYTVQVEGNVGDDQSNIYYYPVYQGFTDPCYVNGITMPLQTQKQAFFNAYPNWVQNLVAVGTGDGGANYDLQVPLLPTTAPQNPPFNALMRGHIDISGIINYAKVSNQTTPLDPPLVSDFDTNIPVTSVDPAIWITAIDAEGNNVVVTDSGQFLSSNINYGLLMKPGKAPFGNTALSGGYSTSLNTVNYLTGTINVTFPVNIPSGNNINVQCYLFQSGIPRSLLFFDNVLTLRAPPAQQYLVELDGYLSPAAYLRTSDAIQFGYMSEYIARGAARKVLSDTGDLEQFQFYEPLFREQEILVWKRSQRQFTSTRTQTIYSQGSGQNLQSFNNVSGGML